MRRRRTLYLGLVAATAAATLGVGSSPVSAAPGTYDVSRLAGQDRYDTAAMIAEQFIDPAVRTNFQLFLATGQNFPDALAVGPVASQYRSPLLLTAKDSIPQATGQFLGSVVVGAAFLFGGPLAISDDVSVVLPQYLGPNVFVDRVAGPDRYTTAIETVKIAWNQAGLPILFLSSGTDFATTLAASAAAADQGGALLLVPQDGIGAMDPGEVNQIIELIRTTGPVKIVDVSTTRSTQELFNECAYLGVAAGLGDSGRYCFGVSAGSPYDVAVQLSQGQFFDQYGKELVIATGENFPDALAASAAVGPAKLPLLLVPRACVPQAVADEVDRLTPSNIVILGGTAAVSPAVDDWFATRNPADLCALTARPVRHPRARRRFGAALLGLLAVAVATPSLATTAVAADGFSTSRLAGGDRYETAALVAEAFTSEPGFGLPRVVVLATGENFPDALAVGPVAGQRGLPVLLVHPQSIPPPTGDDLLHHPADVVYLAGGPLAIADGVRDLLVAGGFVTPQASVVRVAGPDRYATALSVDELQSSVSARSVIYLSSGTDFATTLAASAAAAARGGLLALVPPDGVATMDPAERDRLVALVRSVEPYELIDVSSARSAADLQAECQALLVDAGVDAFTSCSALAASSAYDAAVQLSRKGFPDGVGRPVLVATGRDFPDALAASAAVGPRELPLLLVPGTCVPAAVADEVDRLGPRQVVILGGVNAVAPAVEDWFQSRDPAGLCP